MLFLDIVIGIGFIAHSGLYIVLIIVIISYSILLIERQITFVKVSQPLLIFKVNFIDALPFPFKAVTVTLCED